MHYVTRVTLYIIWRHTRRERELQEIPDCHNQSLRFLLRRLSERGKFLVCFRIDQPSLSDDASTSVGVAGVAVGHGGRASGRARMRLSLPCTEHQPRDYGRLRAPAETRSSVQRRPVPDSPSLQALLDPVSWFVGFARLRQHPYLSYVSTDAYPVSRLFLRRRKLWRNKE